MSGTRSCRGFIQSVAVTLVVALAVASCSGGGEESVSGAAEPSSADGTSDVSVAEQSATSATGDEPLPSGPSIVDGRLTDEALAGLIDGDEVVSERVDALMAEIAALPEDQRITVGNDLAMRADLEAAKITGLEEAAGGAAPLEAALRGAYAQVAVGVDEFAAGAPAVVIPPEASDDPGAPATTAPSGFRSGLGRGRTLAAPMLLQDAPSAGSVAAVGMFMGYMGVSMAADVVTNAGNEAKPGAPAESKELAKDSRISASLEEGRLEMNYTGTQDGVAVKFKAEVLTHPCPKADGTFDIKIKVEVQANKDGHGQNAWVTADIVGQVDDNANLAGYDTTINNQWADFAAGGKGTFVDFTITMGKQGDTQKPWTAKSNRAAGAANPGLEAMGVIMSALIGGLSADYYVNAAQKAWQSGRCVQLDLSASAGPSGLEPNEQVTITAKPKSKLDGAPAGGNVSATMSAGGASVEPSSTPVPADAEFTYTAPDERDKSGTVSAEARSRRGVGKASITLDTKAAAAYIVAGGLQDFQVNQTVCDIMSPFTLNGGVGTADFDGGLSGSYSATGALFSYQGTYTIELSDGLGSPGTMVATSGGQIAGQAGSGSEVYSMTPTTC